MAGSLMLLQVVFVGGTAPDFEVIRTPLCKKGNEYEQSIYEEQFS